MSYQLSFKEEALKEWRKLAPSLQAQFLKVLRRRLVDPHLASAKVRRVPQCYKIKLRKQGYRLVYQVFDQRLVVVVIAVGKGARLAAYTKAITRAQ